jgi:glyoxylase-like metal-dependent hydrolase (beta-lactamase superfamily II)
MPFVAALLVIVSSLVWMSLSGRAEAGAEQRAPSDEIRILPVRGNIFVLSGGGANIVASVGKDGVLLVDTGSASMSEKVVSAVRELSRQVTAARTPQQSCVGTLQGCTWWDASRFLSTTAAPPPPRPIAGIINTSFDPDHMGGNAAIASASSSSGPRAVPGVFVVAHENAPQRHPNPSAVPPQAFPTETYWGTDKKLNFFNGEGVVVWHRPAAHTDGDSVVQFRGSEVLAVGDILNMTSYPIIDVARGGSVQGIIDSLNWILDLAVVEHMMEGGTMIVPGHGRLTDSADVAYYRDMMTIVRDRVRTMIRKGMTLEQIKAAKPTRGYDPRFGRNPEWTPDMFIQAVYRSLSAEGRK